MDNLTLTNTDLRAIELGDAGYINNKGASLYAPETYAKAVEYYRLAAAMGDAHAISNLGYCYLYGRDIEQNTSLAIAYFTLAALREDVDAAYKLGDIYSRDKWVEKDTELSVYYYRMAASRVIRRDWQDGFSILYCEALGRYPSLCYALGRELSRGGAMCTDLSCAYQFLKHAEVGYRRELANGAEFYRESYEGVLRLLADEQFNDVREQIDEAFDDEDYDDEDIPF